MRGKDGTCTVHRKGLRITPAYAGKSARRRFASSACWDHPRLCGEKVQNHITHPRTRGSPPPMRGKVILYIDRHAIFRITPAYAGKSQCLFVTCLYVRDHPRLCGEKLIPIEFGGIETGSPPPMRGKERQEILVADDSGITPAYAGKSSVFIFVIPP